MLNKEHSWSLDLGGRDYVLTGSAGFLGNQFAKAILSAGGNVILLDIAEANLNKQKIHLSKLFPSRKVLSVKLDITDENAVRTFATDINGDSLGGLVNNACVNPDASDLKNKNVNGRFEDFDLEAWNAELGVGLTGSFLMCKHLGSVLAKSSLNGSIVNISSDLGLIGPDQRLYENPKLSYREQAKKPVTYSVIKSGILGLTRYVATYWADNGVRCNAICPGGVLNGQDELFLEKVQKVIPLGRLAEPNEYNSLLIYLLSDQSSYMTGSIISIDGGRTAL